ncbi:MAG TPA: hypothetical protein VFE22_14715, partial [Edaphobacter sp.]|nr:hypothetical protein [Edaphobacter sp.]
MWSLLTSGFALKIWFFLAVWYEVGVELGLDGKAAFVMTLMLLGGGLTLLRLPMQLVGLLGPRVALLVGALVWAGLAWWTVPEAAQHPALALPCGRPRVLAGAACRYVARRVARTAAAARRLS